jgi:CRISPR/Cas system endoribonuclease Cas6 (RAMP superfamily)
MIDINSRELYPALKPTVIKIEAAKLLTPQDANRIGYSLLQDIKAVRDAHESERIPPFTVKNLMENSFELHVMIPVSETAVYLHAKKLGLKLRSIEYPQHDIPPVHSVDGVDITFSSPTAFRWNMKIIPCFEPLLFWRSTLQLWSIFTGYQIEDLEETASGLLISMYPQFIDIRIVQHEIIKGKAICNGFVGSVQLVFAKNITAETKVFALNLLNSATHTGVGIKRAWGMGNLEYTPAGKI